MQHDKQIDAQLKHTVRDLGELLGQTIKHELGQEWSDTGHQSSGVEQDIKENIKTSLLLFWAFLSLHSGSVESDVPVAQLLKEGEQWSNHIVKFIGVHFLSDIFDQVLIG